MLMLPPPWFIRKTLEQHCSKPWLSESDKLVGYPEVTQTCIFTNFEDMPNTFQW